MTFESLRIATGVKALPTPEMFTSKDKAIYCIWSDGSRRRVPAKVRGKAAVKARKRAR